MQPSLVQRLRDSVTQCRALDRSQLLEEAAAEIERLRLTDSEGEAVEWAADHLDNCGWSSATLRGLLDRLK